MSGGADSVAAKDLVTALAGSSAALAGLVLVFMGVVITTIQGFPGDTPSSVMSGYRRSLYATLATFFMSIAGLCVDVAWLASRGSGALYTWTLILFGASVVGVCISAAALAWTLRG
jgi:hypothetical protein